MKTREIALISLFSAVWVASQVYVGQVTHVTTFHGLVQRFMGWFLMLLLAEITGRFGRVSIMAAASAFATRMIRYSASLYVWAVGLGYALGGVAFDALFFIPISRHLKGKRRTGYLIIASLASGASAAVPYILYRLTSFGFEAFVIWLPVYLSRELVDIGLNVLGTLTAVPIIPKIRAVLPTLHVEAKTRLKKKASKWRLYDGKTCKLGTHRRYDQSHLGPRYHLVGIKMRRKDVVGKESKYRPMAHRQMSRKHCECLPIAEESTLYAWLSTNLSERHA